jgi:hypothetical protein
MAVLAAFGTPAFQQDFPDDPAAQEQMNAAWSQRVEGFTVQGILGNPYNYVNASDQTAYFNSLETDIPAGTYAGTIIWSAFPGRMLQYLGDGTTPQNPYAMSLAQLLELCDTGSGFPEIPTNACATDLWDPSGGRQVYGPYGPRGWMDEYCEWSVTRDGAGNITRVDFACENPEYWYTLWSISPQRVAQIYEQTLNYGAPPDAQISVTVDDLAITDPATGDQLYNPLNKWNNGTVSIRGSSGATGGAMHLTSTPNTLQTEINLAASATVQRSQGNASPGPLICCSKYGQPFRHSDPHIGQQVNQIVSGGVTVALADPSGLYIQMPQFSQYELPADPKLPAGAKPEDCWQIVRGERTIVDRVTGEPFPGNFILHVAFALPQAWIDAGVSFTVGDITIAGQPIKWAGQIAATFNMGLFARGLAAAAPAAQGCVTDPAQPTPQPLQTFVQSHWDAYYATQVSNPMQQPMSLASNTVIVPPDVVQGTTVQLALTYAAGTTNGLSDVSFSAEGVEVTAIGAPVDVTYATPGNSYPGPCLLTTLTVEVAAGAALGPCAIQLTGDGEGQQTGPAAPAFLNVVAPSTSE